MNTLSPFASPLYIMVKPAGATCNLRCEYCYYTEKLNLYKSAGEHIMSDEMLERFTREYIESQTMGDVFFTWHGGEPLMRPLSFYKRAIELQKIYSGGRHIENAIQTNGTLLTDEWCRFLHENNWLVGISIDGPQEFHDEFRHTSANKPSFHKVMAGIEKLKKWDVQWNAMAVVNDFNADYPVDFYNFFKKIGAQFIQFTPIVERIKHHDDGRHLADIRDVDNPPLADFSVTPQQWGDFLCGIFDEWVKKDVGETYLQIFDSTLALWAGEQPGLCSMGRYCGHAAVMEANGDVYSCDHFVFPEFFLGNIREHTITEMLYSERQKQFGRVKYDSLPKQCKECKWLFACNGGCPKDRFAVTKSGERGLNYLCEGYRKFFSHVAPYMDFMKKELDNQRPPANIMNEISNFQ